MTAASWPHYAAVQPRHVRAHRLLRRPPCSCGCGQPAIWVGAGSRWANMFRAGRRTTLSASSGLHSASMQLRPRDHRAAADLYADYIGGGIEDPLLGFVLHHPTIDPDMVTEQLAGHDLACSCPPGRPCHADVLLRIANGLVEDSEDIR